MKDAIYDNLLIDYYHFIPIAPQVLKRIAKIIL